MAEEPEKTEEPKPEVNDAARFKAERDRAKGRLEDANARLEALEAKLNEKTAAEEKVEAERRKKAGDFEGIEADLRAQIATAETHGKTLAERVAEYEKRDTDRIESILKDRADADEIRATFEGLPISKQLSLAERFLKSESAAAPAPTGQPGSLAGEKVSADLVQLAKSIYPGDEAKQKIYIEQSQIIAKEKSAASEDGGWPITKPGSRGGAQ